MANRIRIFTALLGLSSVAIFVVSFFLIGILSPDFHIASDYISKLGTQGQPYANCWNLIGFGVVGIALATFGWLFGLCRNDRVLGTCLAVSGIGFALAAIPTDFTDADSSLSKAHYASICFALAGWCCGLARLAGSRSTNDFSQTTANYTVALALLPIVCVGGEISAEPIAHRIVLAIVFTWIILNSIQLLRLNPTKRIAG
jgi:hypothetical membrane protein